MVSLIELDCVDDWDVAVLPAGGRRSRSAQPSRPVPRQSSRQRYGNERRHASRRSSSSHLTPRRRLRKQQLV